MTGPETSGTLRRPWRYSLLTTISDDEGNFDPAMWNRLTEKVAGMVVEAQADAWDAGYQDGYEDNGGPNPYRVQEDPVTTDHAAQKLAEMRDLRGISTTEHEEHQP
jgi:hypothetical protein